ncbi:hypothetical protein F4805DRAFT_459469 [Annulohypoxylon moriforme]|nr:hypothetical protein F4805DRAFT_459469 [Annulohypoxylon moriforme]
MDHYNIIFIFERDHIANCQLLLQANILILIRISQGFQLQEMMNEVTSTMAILPQMTNIWHWYATLGFVIMRILDISDAA